MSQNLQENTCARIFFLIKLQTSACNFIKKESLAQVFFYEFYDIFKNTSFRKHLRMPASNAACSFISFRFLKLKKILDKVDFWNKFFRDIKWNRVIFEKVGIVDSEAATGGVL